MSKFFRKLNILSNDNKVNTNTTNQSVTLKTGYIEKGERLHSSWKQCWCVIKDNVLACYESPETSIKIDSVNLLESLLIPNPHPSDDEFIFSLQTAVRKFYFRVPNATELESWQTTLRNICPMNIDQAAIEAVSSRIEAESIEQTENEVYWIDKLRSLSGVLHSSGPLCQFAVWLSELETEAKTNLNTVSPRPSISIVRDSSLWLRTLYSKDARVDRTLMHNLNISATALLSVWTKCEELRILCPFHGRIALILEIVTTLQNNDVLRQILEVKTSSTQHLIDAMNVFQQRNEHPPNYLLLDLQKRIFACLLLLHEYWLESRSFTSASLHLIAYPDVNISDRYRHAVDTNDNYLNRHSNQTLTTITRTIATLHREELHREESRKRNLERETEDHPVVSEEQQRTVEISTMNAKSNEIAEKAPDDEDVIVIYLVDRGFWDFIERGVRLSRKTAFQVAMENDLARSKELDLEWTEEFDLSDCDQVYEDSESDIREETVVSSPESLLAPEVQVVEDCEWSNVPDRGRSAAIFGS